MESSLRNHQTSHCLHKSHTLTGSFGTMAIGNVQKTAATAFRSDSTNQRPPYGSKYFPKIASIFSYHPTLSSSCNRSGRTTNNVRNECPSSKRITMYDHETSCSFDRLDSLQVVNMGYLSIVGSHAVNGVAQLHSDLLKSTL